MSRRDGTTTKVFVGSLPSAVTTQDLRKLFTPYGKIVECDIANRCGFLHLEDRELAEKAIEDLNNSNFMGGRISVEKGRVKPPKSRGRERDNGRSGVRDRGGPYSRDDDFGRGSRNGMGYGPPGRGDYGFDRYGGYDRGPARGYGPEFDIYSDRRPMYDDRSRDYVDDRRGYASNGYGRGYEDRMSYPSSRGGYDDRRMPPPYGDVLDDRRPPSSDHRSLLDPVSSRPSAYDRGASSNDMYSRRGDPPSKATSGYGDREQSYGGSYGASGATGDSYGSSGGYGGAASSHGYGGTSNSGGYGTSGSYGTGYDNASAGGIQNVGQNSGPSTYGSGSGAYSSGAGTYGGGGYSGSGGAGYGSTSSYGTGAGGYSGGGGGYGNSGAGAGGTGYGSGQAGDAYGSSGAQGGYGDSYGGSRGSYDSSSFAAPSRGLSSGGVIRDRERDSRRSLTSGPERRY